MTDTAAAPEKPRIRVPVGVRRTTDAVAVRDGFQNFEAALGLGANNQMASSHYGLNPLTRNRVELENMYRSSWIVRQAVSVPADDMTRGGIEFYGLGQGADGNEREPLVLQNALDRLDVWGKLASTIRWARLYGGALAVILVEGHDLTQPLDPSTITRGQFKGLLPIDRWSLTPSSDTVTELGPDFGKPVGYAVITGREAGAAVGGRWIHHTRVVRLEGNDLPYYQRQAEMGWGLSVVETFHDRLVAFDSTTLGMAQLVYKAHLRTIKMKDLRKNIATGGKPFAAALTQVDLIRRYQSNEGVTLLDADDSFDASSYTFGGLSDVMVQMAQQIAGAIDMPIVKLFGMSPAGFSTGDTDLRSYNDNIHLAQERDLRRPMEVLARITFRSEYGEAPPDTFGFNFASLYGLNAKEKADIAVQVATAVSTVESTTALKSSTVLRELKRSSETTGIFASITDQDITRAEDEEADLAAPPPESDGPGEAGDPVADADDPAEPLPQKVVSLVPRIRAAA